MLDVHPPHHAISGWRDFFIHIATITIGLLIAIGLEQTVEYIHHRHQLAEMVDSIRAEGAENQAAAATDMRAADAAIAGASAAIARLQAPAARGADPVTAMPEIILLVPSDSAWSAARDVGLLSLASRELVDNGWKIYFMQQASMLQIRKVYADLDTIQALAGVHPDAAQLDPAPREALLVAYANYRESLKVLKIDLDLLNQKTGMAIQGGKIDAKSL